MLSLTTAQEALRQKLSRDHVEPLYWMRVDHEVLMAVAVSATDISSRSLTLTPDVSAAETVTGFSSTSSSTAAAEELALALGDRAWRKGNVVYIRAAFQDSTLAASGDLISSGDASVLFTTPRGSEFVSGAHDVLTPPDFVRFDSAPNEYVFYGQTDDLAGESLATWSGWVRLSANYGSGYQGFLMGFLIGGGGWSFDVTTSWRARLRAYNASGGTAQTISSTTAFTRAQWHHFAATFSGGTVSLYVDGALVSSATTGTMPSALQPVSITLPSQGLKVGDNFGQAFNHADLKHLAYYAGQAATASQVLELYGQGTPPDLDALPTLPSPTFWAPLNGTYELAQGSQSPTLVGSPTFGPEAHATASILEVSTMGVEKDPWTKQVAATARSVVLNGDASVTRMLTQNMLVGREVTIRRGLRGYPVSEWLPSGVYLVTDGPLLTEAQSTAEAGQSAYRLKMRDKLAALLENVHFVSTQDNWSLLQAGHPVEQAQRVLERAVYLTDPVPTASSTQEPILDESTFDLTSSAWSDISHWSSVFLDYKSDLASWPSSYGIPAGTADIEYTSGFTRPVKATEVLGKLRTLIPGQVMPEEDGKVRARRIDYSTIPGGTATIHDWSEEFEADEAPDLMADLINEIIIDLSGDVSGEEWQVNFTDRNLSSIRAHGAPSAQVDNDSPRGGRRSDDSLKLGSGGKSYMIDCINSGSTSLNMTLTAQSFRVFQQAPFGFSGGRSDGVSAPPYTMPAFATLTSGRVALFRLDSPLLPATAYDASAQPMETTEYIESNASAIDSTVPDFQWYGTSYYGQLGHVRYTISKRAALGTTSPTVWNQWARITDCTIARALTTEYLDRWGWGFPVVTGRTRLGLLHHQVGDFVQISLPRLIGFGGEGADNLGLVFEVVGKEEAYDRVTWRLALASRLTPYVAIQQHQIPTFTISSGGEPE